ncbi:MAG: prepilin peptidase [Actinomycetota bacterium]|nr:prepilin peptidase [Actinomycetota bacterium]
MTWFYYFVSFCFGLIFGSFFNVCIYRIPKKGSLGERSRCPFCGEIIRWYDNIPLLSFALLRAKCRHCHSPISIQYPIVEALTGSLFVLAYWWSTEFVPKELHIEQQVIIPELFLGLILVSILIIISVIDIQKMIIPNIVIGPGIALSFLLVVAFSLSRSQPGRISLSLLSGTIGSGFLLIVGLLYGYLFTEKSPPSVEGDKGESGEEEINDEGEGIRTGVGFGDIKLVFFTGLVLGYFHWYLILVQLFFGFLIGSLVSIALMLIFHIGRKEHVPFGPFLAAGAVISLVFGSNLVEFYLKMFR